MLVTKFDLELANYVQDKEEIDFETCIKLYNKSKSTLKRSIYRLNEYLPEHLHFSISNHSMKTNMKYEDFAMLCQKLELENYSTSIGERLKLIVCYGFLEDIVNMTELYHTLGLSISTKKKDRQELGYLLEAKDVQIINRHRLGVSFVGNEQFQRMYVARKLMSVIELDRYDNFVERKANTPIHKMLYLKFEEHLAGYHSAVIARLNTIFDKEEKNIDYASKKFIYIHAAISLMRIEKGHKITNQLIETPKVTHHNLLPSEKDSQYFDYLIASLNYKQPLNFPSDNQLKKLTTRLIEVLKNKLAITFYTYQDMYDALYAYLYKCQIKNKLNYYFYDDKLDDTKHVLAKLYGLVEKETSEFKDLYNVHLNEHQISTICLIIERFIIKNRVINKNRRKIIIITNSSVEKVNFFLEALSQHINFEMVSYLTINELYKLNELTFDTIVTFSNRITMLLSELGWKSTKLNFYLTTDDIKKLLDTGFTSTRSRKIVAWDIVNELEKVESKEEKTAYLKKHYPEYML